MAAETIKVEGYRATIKALGDVDRGTKRAVFAGLRAAAEPIAADARSKLSGFQGISLGTIKPSARSTGVVVIQRAKKTTGKRADFGALQMRKGLLPALEENEDTVACDVEAAFYVLTKKEGF